MAGVAATVTLALTLGSCADAQGPPAEDRDAAPVVSQTFENGGRCPEVNITEVPGPLGCATATEADLDGDGTLETVAVIAALKPDGYPRHWHLDVFSGPDRSSLRAGVSFPRNEHSYPKLIGAADLDGDGADEIFVKVLDHLFHSGGSQVVEAFHLPDRGTLEPVRVRGEGPLTFTVGGLTRFGEGAVCEAPMFTLVRIDAVDLHYTRWEVSRRTYRFEHGKLVRSGGSHEILRTSDFNDPAVDPFYRLRCGALVYPPLL